MKIFKILSCLIVLVAGLSGCGESSYTPTTLPYSQTGTPTGYNNNTPFNNNYNTNPGYVNPYFAQPGTNYNGMPYPVNPQQAALVQLQINQSMSCQARSAPYLYAYLTSNCGLRRVPTYTPSSCACVKLPCSCQNEIEKIRKTCVYRPVRIVKRTTTCTSCSVSTPVHTSPSQNNASEDDDANSNVISDRFQYEFFGPDAEAIYKRLATQERDLSGVKDSKKKVRGALFCTSSKINKSLQKQAKTDRYYNCMIDTLYQDGVVLKQTDTGNEGPAEIVAGISYSGDLAQVANDGLDATEGYIRVKGSLAKVFYKNLSMKEQPGTLNLNGTFQANVKTGKDVTCYQTLGTTSVMSVCQIKINTLTGEAISNN